MSPSMYIMRNTGLDILILSVVDCRLYASLLDGSFFNTLVGRLILLEQSRLAIKDTLWALFGILLLVGFRDGLVHEGMTNMDKDADGPAIIAMLRATMKMVTTIKLLR